MVTSYTLYGSKSEKYGRAIVVNSDSSSTGSTTSLSSIDTLSMTSSRSESVGSGVSS